MRTSGRKLAELSKPESWFFSHAPNPTTEAIFGRAIRELNLDTGTAMADTGPISSRELEFRLGDTHVELTNQPSHLTSAAIESLENGFQGALRAQYRNTYQYKRFGSLSLFCTFVWQASDTGR